jgi:hypothetical protein
MSKFDQAEKYSALVVAFAGQISFHLPAVRMGTSGTTPSKEEQTWETKS